MSKKASLRFVMIALIITIGLACRGQEIVWQPTEKPTQGRTPHDQGGRLGTPQRTPTPTSTPKATATLTPTVTSTPTVTPQLGERLQAARISQRNGNYEEAIAEYEAILASKATAEDMREARFRLGEGYLLNGEWELAIEALQGFLQAHPKDERCLWATFLLARAYEGQEDWPQAIVYYRRYLAQKDIIASYVHEFIGDCYIELEDYPKAIAEYEEALQEALYASQEVELMEKMAQACASLENYEQAIAWYEAILEKAKIGRYRAQIEYMMGQAYQEWGKAEKAHRHFLEAVDHYPESGHAYLSLIKLVEAGVEIDEFQRGLVNYYAGAYGPAIRALRRYIELAKPTSRLDDVHYYLGLAYRETEDFASALGELDLIIKDYPESEHWGSAWLEKAEVLAESEKLDEAVRVYRKFAELYPYHELAEEALWRTARLMEGDGRYREAAEAYLDLEAGFPQGERAGEAPFRAGLCCYRLASYEKAEEVWRRLSKTQESDICTKALFWTGKSLLRRGEIREARRCFEEVGAEPDGYYVWRARAISGELDEVALPSKGGEAMAEAEKWLADWLGVPRDSLGGLDPPITGDARFEQGRELARVGLWEKADRALRSLVKESADSPLSLYQLALSFRQMGLTRLSILCVEKLIEFSPAEAIGDVPIFLQQLAYPLCFGDLVASESQANGLDPFLLLALIRQESRFDEHATSRAGARGLTQIIPATGEWIALKLGRRGYRADDLYRPCLNVRFGAWYLAQQFEKFDGDILAALAAYNSGPNRARRWFEEAAGDDDLLLETISLAEPRLFASKVYEQYAVYRFLYGKAKVCDEIQP